MAVHTYVVQPLTVVQVTATDVLWQATGTADGVPWTIQFWQSSVAGKTLAQIEALLKPQIDLVAFPPTATPAGGLANFSGGTFTL